jgi:hypothetical protein
MKMNLNEEILKEFSRRFVLNFDELVSFLEKKLDRKKAVLIAKREIGNLKANGFIKELDFIGKCYAITQKGIKTVNGKI